MPHWPDEDEALLNEFLEQLGYAPHNLWGYRAMLRHFQRFVSKRKRPLNVQTVRSWVRTSAAGTSRKYAIQRVVFVKRFVDWLVERGIVPASPFVELRARYECNSTSAIARALLQPDSATALEALRPPSRYASHLGAVIREHIERMRSLGMRYSHAYQFAGFDLFLQQQPDAEKQSYETLAHEYVSLASSPATRLARLCVTRVIAKALRRTGITVAEPARDRLLIQEVARRRIRPHIYSAAEIHKLLETARNYERSKMPLRAAALHCMITLAYCAGLRLGELAGLRVEDVDLEEQTIDIRDTKFFKSRCLPLSSSAVAVVRGYLIQRHSADFPTHSDAPLFCHSGGGYSRVRLGQLLRRVIRLAGINTMPGRGGPRIHDLRHTFVVHRMTQWYDQGINPQNRLQHLATYLGHRDVHSTLVYLTITQELLQKANRRFWAAEADVLKVIRGEV